MGVFPYPTLIAFPARREPAFVPRAARKNRASPEGRAALSVLCGATTIAMRTSLLFLLVLTAGLAIAQPAGRFQEIQSARIIQTVDPIFPDSLIATYRRGGQASVLISIDTEGRLADWLAIRYTDAGFADAAVAALKQWQFVPARLRGEPVPVCIELQFNFEVKGVVVSVSPADLITANFNDITGGVNYAPCTLRDLDRIPVPLQTVSPLYPKQLAERGTTGEVTVDFFIDERGAVRMPYVTGDPHQMLANLAVDAVRQWKFEPPTRRGLPVLVHVRQVFRFTPTITTKG
jgi:TonB family protein